MNIYTWLSVFQIFLVIFYFFGSLLITKFPKSLFFLLTAITLSIFSTLSAKGEVSLQNVLFTVFAFALMVIQLFPETNSRDQNLD